MWLEWQSKLSEMHKSKYGDSGFARMTAVRRAVAWAMIDGGVNGISALRSMRKSVGSTEDGFVFSSDSASRKMRDFWVGGFPWFGG